MSIDPDLRIALGFILSLRIGIGIFFSGQSPEIGILPELRRLNAERPWPLRLIWALLTLPLVPFLFDEQGLAWAFLAVNSSVAEYSIIWLPDSLRWTLLIPAVAGLLLLIWSFHSAVSPAELDSHEPSTNRFLTGPFHRVRFPQWQADSLLFGSLALATANWGAVLAVIGAWMVLCFAYLPEAETAWRRLLGDAYADYAGRTGAVLPRLPGNEQTASTRSYSVPKRFGMSAIIGLMTMFAVIFGAVNLLQAQITEIDLSMLHIFFGLQLMSIWIAQMRFGSAPRRVSAFVGAVLLPTFVFFSLHSQPWQTLVALFIALFFVGGVIGYCVGAIAAGLFLFMDWLGKYSSGAQAAGFPTDSKHTGN